MFCIETYMASHKLVYGTGLPIHGCPRVCMAICLRVKLTHSHILMDSSGFVNMVASSA